MIIETLILVALILGTISDIKSREVPDTLSFGLIGISFLIAITLSFFHASFSYLINSSLGFAAGYILGLIFYFAGMWGGGDAKIIMGIGAAIGLNPATFAQELPLLFVFIINIFIAGAIYGLVWLIVLAIKNFKPFKQELIRLLDKKRMLKSRIILFIFILILNAVALFTNIDLSIKIAVLVSSTFFILFFYISFIIKAIEKTCMFVELPVEKLTEGDWVIEKIKLKNGKFFTPNKTGLSLEDISLLSKNKIRKVMIKEGIPFIPSFLLAYILILIFGNWFPILF